MFSKKFPLICKDNFDFVKRDRNTISTPVVKEDHKWDYAHVKHLCGAGKLYVRLNVSKDVLVSEIKEIGEDLEEPPVIDLSQPSTSSGKRSIDSKIDSLAVLFPSTKRSDIAHAIMINDDIDSAASHLSEIYNPGIESQTGIDSGTVISKHDSTISDILNKLKTKMNPYCTAEKIKVDRDDVVMDVFQHYKDSNFSPHVPVKFQIKGEPAVDGGGVLRQVYQDFFSENLAR